MYNPRGALPAVCIAVTAQCLLLQAANADRITYKDFDAETMEMSGPGWRIVKYPKNTEGSDGWRARFEADGEVVHTDLGAGARDANWIAFKLYATPENTPDLLMVFWYPGGAHGPYRLRIIALTEGFPMIFNTGGTSFAYAEDLDQDKIPEIVTHSRAFQPFYGSPIDFGGVGSPSPLLVATYDEQRRRFMWANEHFPDVLREPVEKSHATYLERWPDTKEIPVDVVLKEDPEALHAYTTLMTWAVYACYAENEKAAYAIIDKYTDPTLAVFSKHAVRITLQRDGDYNSMINNPVQRDD